MYAEGVGAAITPEFLRATATGFPLLAGAMWTWIGLGALWRRWIWRQAGAAVTATARGLGGRVVPRWDGWRIEARACTIDFGGGPSGPWTEVRLRHQPLGWRDLAALRWRTPRVLRAGLLGPEEAAAALAELED